jgi:hypothetical protein
LRAWFFSRIALSVTTKIKLLGWQKIALTSVDFGNFHVSFLHGQKDMIRNPIASKNTSIAFLHFSFCACALFSAFFDCFSRLLAVNFKLKSCSVQHKQYKL